MISQYFSLPGILPSLLGAIAVLAVGWVVSLLVGRLVERALQVVKIDRGAGLSGLQRYLSDARPGLTVSHSIGVLAKWFLMLVFIQAAANLLAMPQVTTIMNSVLLFIPNLIVALIIVVAGAVAARFLADLVSASAARAGAGSPRALALIAQYAVLGFAAIAALTQLGIAVTLINTLFIGLVASLALASGLAFGLGAQGVAGEISRAWYEKGKAVQERLKTVPRDNQRKGA